MAEDKRIARSYKSPDKYYNDAKSKCDKAGFPLANVVEQVVMGIADGVGAKVEIKPDESIVVKINYSKVKKQ